jgi:hypothetical protein
VDGKSKPATPRGSGRTSLGESAGPGADSGRAATYGVELSEAALASWRDAQLLTKQPRVELLPEDDARPLTPPSDTELNATLGEARAPALLEVAPLFPEAIELSVETSLAKRSCSPSRASSAGSRGRS